MYSDDSYRWWTKDEKHIANDVFQYVSHLSAQQSYRENDNIKHMRLYGNLEAYAFQNYAFRQAEPVSVVQNRVTLNIIQSMIDTVVSKITKNKPKATFLTNGGDWSMQRKAQKLTQFAEGQFQATDFYSKATIAFKDSCIFGTGALKIFRRDDEICVERVFINEIVIDDKESIYGSPRQIHQKKYIHKDVLKEMFPEYKNKIDSLGQTEISKYSSNSYDRSTNMVLVIESWHLPSGKNAKDGVHAISIENQCLFKEEYKRDYFPFVFWRYNLRPVGFFGQGIAEQLTGLQLEINKILRTIQVSMHLVSVPKLLVEASSKVVSAHLNNKIGGIIKYAGTPPTYAQLGSIPQDLFNHLDRLFNRAYEVVGVSQLSATSQKPAGLDSGKALREYNDIETERFMTLGMRYESTFLEAAKQMIDLAKEINEDGSTGDYSVKVADSSSFQEIKWSDIALDRDQYVMQIFPTNSLSSHPAGRLQDVQELLQAGFIGKEDAMKLLDFPDLKQFYNFNNAGVEDIERAIEAIVDKEEYQTPEPYQNLEYGIVKMQQAYLLYRSQGAPEETLELFRRWIGDADALLKKANQPEPVPEAPVEQPLMPNEAAPMTEEMPPDQAQLPQ